MVPGLPGLLSRPEAMDMHGSGMGASMAMDQAMDMSPMGLVFFTSMWVAMMVAMMFPSAAPMVIMQWRMARRREQGPLSVPVFVGGYLITWTVIGLAFYLAYRLIVEAAPSIDPTKAGLAAGAVLALAGAYQLTKLKEVCLSNCRSPLEFLMKWKEGYSGAAGMGLRHGLYCVGCCWGLMVVLFVVGLMNLAWMGIVAALIFVEKVAPFGRVMARAVGVGLIAVGIAFVVWPGLVPAGIVGG